MRLLSSALTLWLAAAAAEPANPYAPWGTHLAFGEDPTTMMSVMWSTRLSPAAASVVDATPAAFVASLREAFDQHKHLAGPAYAHCAKKELEVV